MTASDNTTDELNGDELHLLIFKHLETMLDNPDKHGIYPTTDFMVNLKRDIQRLIVAAQINEVEMLPEWDDRANYYKDDRLTQLRTQLENKGGE